MRKKGVFLLTGLTVVLLVIILAGCSTVNLTGQQEGIVVSGEGKVSVVPDVATLSLGVEAENTSVTVAQNESASTMAMVMDALTDNGVAEEDIQTQYFNIYRVTRWDDETWQEVVVGYRVSNTVSVKIRDMDNIGSVIDAVVDAGGDLTRINGIRFSIEDPSIYYDEAREEAMADAQVRAETLAELGGVKLGKPIHISENVYQPGEFYVPGARFDEVIESTTPISPGETEITLDVQVTYDIRN